MDSQKISPFVKWAGGKRQILNKIKQKLPKNINRYFEPFVGGGAVLFTIEAKEYFINDINTALINVYKNIKDNYKLFINELSKYDQKYTSKEDYYYIRAKYNQKLLKNEYDMQLAAMFVYINKRCFNGLYRVNSKGEFNVPFNGNQNHPSFSEENIKNVSLFLNRKIKIMNHDFAEVLNEAKKGDFIFIDSPYDVVGDAIFVAYNKTGFTKDDHIRLSEEVKKLDKKGCLFMITNHNTPLINQLYKGFNKEVIVVKRMINRDKNKRTGEEIIITNY
ncbi:DNA adenine methylase [Mycoplasma sp. 394]